MTRPRIDQIKTAAELSLCPQCFVHFVSPKDEDIFNESVDAIKEFNISSVDRILHATTYPVGNEARTVLEMMKSNYSRATSPLCACCFGAVSNNTLEELCERVINTLIGRESLSNDVSTPVCISVVVPPIMDAYRITARTVITHFADKMFPFPSVDELLTRVLTRRLSTKLNIVPASEARVQITLKACADYQLKYCNAVWEDFKIKKIKRRYIPAGKLTTAASAEGDDTVGEKEEEIARKSIDSLFMYYKAMDNEGMISLEQRLKDYMSVVEAQQTAESSQEEGVTGSRSHAVRWEVSSKACPLYLLGRYRKLARDVPQSPWTITTQGNNNSEDSGDAEYIGEEENVLDITAAAENDATDELTAKRARVEGDDRAAIQGNSSKLQYKRKGRSSVEEIINAVAKVQLRAVECRMHPCGREDIDVRCLGNGRPFAMEVLDPAVVAPTQQQLDAIRDAVNRGEGLNAEKDVEVAHLSLANRSLWENMQTKAEEKRKGYCCVVWTERGVSREELKNIEVLSRSGAMRDETGEACIELSQKTPLRVLHRRSLLDRKRHVYEIETTLLSPHFFLMRLVTSAGTYVKEFVHGDLGRTVPSICSLLNCQADIMQLDVTWLYDDMEGNDPSSTCSTISHNCGSSSLSAQQNEVAERVEADRESLVRMTLESLNTIPLPNYIEQQP